MPLTDQERLALALACQRQAAYQHGKLAALLKKGRIYEAIHTQGLAAEWSAAARRYLGLES